MDTPALYATAWAVLPPLIAIVLALITKEVYSSLFLGVLTGAILYAGADFDGILNHLLYFLQTLFNSFFIVGGTILT